MSAWSSPVEVLSDTELTGGAVTPGGAAGTPVTSYAVNYERVMAVHALQVTLTGVENNGFAAITLQGSLDGVNWYTISGTSPSANEVGLVAATNTPAQYVQVTVTPVTGYPSAGGVFTATLRALVIAQEVA